MGPSLRCLRELRGFSQHELAQRTGMSRAQLSGYESGRALPQLNQLERLLDGLDVSPWELVAVLESMSIQQGILQGGRKQRSASAVREALAVATERGLVPPKLRELIRSGVEIQLQIQEEIQALILGQIDDAGNEPP